MQSFLDLCAQHLAQEYQANLGRVCIVLPTRRSGLVLKQLLKAHKAQKLPHITHIEDFVTEATSYTKSSPVMLLLEMYEIFSQIDPKIKLERFTSWGYILIKDFDQIDRNLVDAERLFQNLSDIKNIERWRLGEDKITPRIGEYFQLWENLHETYQQFRARLLEEEQAYPGMMYRHLAENAESLLLGSAKTHEHYIFIGFNALSKAEEQIFKTLMDHQKAEIIWDADEYYVKENTENKAGLFLKKYNQNWNRTNWKFRCNYLLESAKDIQVISVANTSMQGKVANQLLKNWTPSEKDQPNPLEMPHTAIVLADENILMPTLHSLDEQFAGLNITIGLSLKDSALFNLVDALFEQHQTYITDRETQEIKFSHRSVIKLLNHPFIRQYERQYEIQTEEGDEENSESHSLILLMINFINRNNLIFISLNELLDIVESETFQERFQEEQTLLDYCQQAMEALEPLFRLLFQPWKNTFEVIRNLEALSELLYSEENYFEAAYFKEFQKMLRQLKGFVQMRPRFIDIRTFKIFLYQAFRETKFDFDSNQASPLQLMGIVETRNLDFEQVIMLSVNETTLPRSKKINSFIPVDVCREFGIPSYTEQDAVVSYHFYRLLQRAQKIALVYTSPSDTYGGKEKSRFIHQLQNDLAQQNPKIRIREIPAQYRSAEEKPEQELIIEKDAQLLAQIKAHFARGLSPSHINSFLRCSLQYYFSQLAEIGSASRVEETLGADKLGSLIHEILEDLFQELSQENRFVDEAALEGVLPSVPQRVQAKFQLDKYANYVITGQNYIVKQVTTQYILKFLRSQIEEIRRQGAAFEILSLENREAGSEDTAWTPRIYASLELKLAHENIPLTLRGITDRIDKVKDQIRIVDYKTSKVESNQVRLAPDELERLVDDPKADKIRQLWLYKYMIAKRVVEGGSYHVGNYPIQANEPITAGIYSLRNLEEGLIEIQSKDKKNPTLFPEDLQAYVKTSETFLAQIIEKMLDTSQAFEKTTDLEICQFCAYREICGR